MCGNTTSVELDVTTQATDVAYAVAEAFAEVVAQCETQGSADARAQAYAYAQDRAEALGEAIAGVWADVTVCDSCSVVADTFVSVSNLLIADAVAEAWTDVRASPSCRPGAACLAVPHAASSCTKQPAGAVPMRAHPRAGSGTLLRERAWC